MKIDRLEALLWARIDGTIEPEELAELEAHLAEHPEPRDIERQIATIAEELEHAETEEPPAVLRERIDGALANATPPAALTDRPKATPHTLSSTSKPTFWLPMAASLLIGVAIGYLLHPGTGIFINESGVTGSMLTPPVQTSVAPVTIEIDGGTVTASRAGADVVIDVLLTTEVDLDVTLAGAGGPVRLESLNTTTALATEVATEHGWAVVRTRGPGTVTFSVSAFDADDPLWFQVSSDGIPVEEAWIGPSRNEVVP
jgi:hypothetical protein